MRNVIASIAAVCAAGLGASASAEAPQGGWVVDAGVSPLTDAPFFSGRLQSTEPLINMIGVPEHATLVLRCRDATLAAYVSWPEVLHQDGETAFLGLPQTLVLTRIDGGAITSGFWILSNERTAAGGFDNRSAPKLISSIAGAKRLVVRLSGRKTQDAVFDLAGIDQVVARTMSTCGMANSTPPAATTAVTASPPSPAEPATGGVEGPVSRPAADVLAAAQKVLAEAGYTVTAVDPSEGVLATAPRDLRLTTKQADCGKSFGIAYLADKRASTSVTVFVRAEAGRLRVRADVQGSYRPGYGAPDKQLACTSTGAIEADLHQMISQRL